MEMHQIRYFLAVAELLNFTRAAEQCNVTQPALTRAIQKLEEELGGLLFRRERSLTHLTELGRLMQPHLKQVLEESEAARTTAKSFLRLDEAHLNLGVMCTIGPMRFVAFLRDFNARHPGVDVRLLETVPSMLSDQLLAEKLDVAVAAKPDAFDERLRLLPLYRERFVVAFPSGHRFEQRNAVPLAELKGEGYLRRVNCEYADHIGNLRQKCGAEVRRLYASEREDWIQAMIAAGLGVCIMPEHSPSTPGVITRPVIEPEITREVGLLTIAGRRHSPAVAAFIRAAQTYRWPSKLPVAPASAA
jgi:LysR family transcriptional regulator, hydrogen peroxide-inducible genes activator